MSPVLISVLLLLGTSLQGPGITDRETPRISIEAEATIPAPAQAAVKVVLVNPGPRKLAFTGVPAVRLRPVAGTAPGSTAPLPAFWAPFDAATGLPLTLHANASLTLSPGETRTLHLRLGDLAWGTEYQARWPESPLARIPGGRYTLVVELPVRDHPGPSQDFRSQEREVLLWMEPTRPRPRVVGCRHTA